MKVKMTKHSREIISIAQMDAAKETIELLREGDDTAAEYVECAARIAGMTDCRVLQASAEMCRNCRVWDRYMDNGGDLDVWLDGIVMGSEYDRATGEVTFVVYEIGACLSDVLDGTGADNAYDYSCHFFLQRYVKQS